MYSFAENGIVDGLIVLPVSAINQRAVLERILPRNEDGSLIIPRFNPENWRMRLDLGSLLEQKNRTDREVARCWCPEFFPTEEQLQAHYALHREGNLPPHPFAGASPPVVCNLCDLPLEKEQLFYHLVLEHTNIPDKATLCVCPSAKCDFYATSYSEFDSHNRVVHGVFTYRCPVCNFDLEEKDGNFQHAMKFHNVILTDYVR